MSSKTKKLLIIGGGNMGYAIAYGITKNGIYSKAEVIFLEKKQARIAFLRKGKYSVFSNLNEVIKKYHKNLETIIIAVKPADVSNTLAKLKKVLSEKTLVVSIAAGIRLQKLASLLSKNSKNQPIARIMPNTPCQVQEGMNVITFNKHVSKKQRKQILEIFQAIGKTTELEEDKFDLVTAISGSGPAYFCYLIECLVSTATKSGLNSKIAQELVLQTALGTMALLAKTNLTPKTLREYVTSPKGTTEAALQVFQKSNFYDIVYSAVRAAKERSKELGKI